MDLRAIAVVNLREDKGDTPMRPEELRQARIGAKLTQFDLARIVGIPEGRVSRLETGRTAPRPGELNVIQTVLKFASRDDAAVHALREKMKRERILAEFDVVQNDTADEQH